jgi:hypothetical protein
MDTQQNPPAPSMPPIPTTEEGGTPPPMPPAGIGAIPPSQGGPAPQNPASDGSASSNLGIPPVITTPKKKFGGGKIIATILGLLLLVGSIGAGVVLVQQKQLFQQKAGLLCSGGCICSNMNILTGGNKNGTCSASNACKCTCPSGYSPSNINTCKISGSTKFDCTDKATCPCGCNSTRDACAPCATVVANTCTCVNGSVTTNNCDTKSNAHCTQVNTCSCSAPTSGGNSGSGSVCPPSNNNPNCTGGSLINGTCGNLDTVWSCSPTGGVTLSCCKPKTTGGGTTTCPPASGCPGGSVLNDTCGNLDTVWSCSPTGGVTLVCCKPKTGGTTCSGTGSHGGTLSCSTQEACSGTNKVAHTEITTCTGSNYAICCETISNSDKCAGIGCAGSTCTAPSDVSNCYVNHYWCKTRKPGGCSDILLESVVKSASFSKDCGTEQMDIYCPDCGAGANPSEGGKYLSKTYDQDCSGGGELNAQCLAIKVYDTDWNQLNATELSALSAGAVVRFTISGSASSGTIDKARFTVTAKIGEVNESTPSGDVTNKKPGTEEFYYEYAIPAGATSIKVTGQVHHATLGWF